MAHPKRSLPGNAPGDLYVDDTCIDCDTCRWMAPGTFHRTAGQSAVRVQPESSQDRRLALLALTACPTASIGTRARAPEMPAIRSAFPVPVAEEVYHCGYHSAKSYGAAGYFIRRAEGNVLVDSPRRSETLAARLQSLGGVRWLFLTHGDDVADHDFWRERFACERIIHAGDAGGSTLAAERILVGEQTVELAPDLRIIPVPGHTQGSCALLYRDAFLFTGDHLAYSQRRAHLYAFRDACWHSWRQQTESMEKLRGYPFEWVLPGHGRRFHAGRVTMREQLETCIGWMRGPR